VKAAFLEEGKPPAWGRKEPAGWGDEKPHRGLCVVEERWDK